MIMDFLYALTFWDWYWVTVFVWWVIFMIVSWAVGEVTVKSVAIVALISSIPIINMVFMGLGIIGGISAFFESDQDVTLWKRNTPE